MIEAIIPMPCRYPVGYRLGYGFMPINQCYPRMSASGGRRITVQPLLFYKFFSNYGAYSYEHTFASDTLIDPVTLERTVNITNSQTNKVYGGTLVPISVKRISPNDVKVFLFPVCIDFLLQTYVPGVPIDEAPVFEDERHMSQLCDAYYNGVCGMYELTMDYLANSARRDWNFGISKEMDTLLTRISPEAPETCSSFVAELEMLHLADDQLMAYLSDLQTWEQSRSFNMQSYLLRDVGTMLPLDPVTELCVSTPSYLYGHQLRPYLADESHLRRYAKLGYQQPVDPYIRWINITFEKDDPYSWSDALMQELLTIGDSDVWITVDQHGMTVTTNGVTPSGPSVYDGWERLIRQTCPFSRVTINKTWADEILMEVEDQNELKHFYLHLGWYHLMTPSLANMRSRRR